MMIRESCVVDDDGGWQQWVSAVEECECIV